MLKTSSYLFIVYNFRYSMTGTSINENEGEVKGERMGGQGARPQCWFSPSTAICPCSKHPLI